MAKLAVGLGTQLAKLAQQLTQPGWARPVAASSFAGPLGPVAMATNGSDTPAPPPWWAETTG